MRSLRRAEISRASLRAWDMNRSRSHRTSTCQLALASPQRRGKPKTLSSPSNRRHLRRLRFSPAAPSSSSRNQRNAPPRPWKNPHLRLPHSRTRYVVVQQPQLLISRGKVGPRRRRSSFQSGLLVRSRLSCQANSRTRSRLRRSHEGACWLRTKSSVVTPLAQTSSTLRRSLQDRPFCRALAVGSDWANRRSGGRCSRARLSRCSWCVKKRTWVFRERAARALRAASER